MLERILDIALIPVVRASTPNDAFNAAVAVSAGGIPIVEITMTVPGAIEVIRELSQNESLVVGAGTVLDPETARACIDAGAEFVVGPTVNFETIEVCRESRKLVMPGALTPTEVFAAWQAGADLVKVFPCDSVGGPRYIKSLRAPLPQVQIVPTGGVTVDTAKSFLDAGAVALGIGTDLVDPKSLASGRLNAITEKARKYVAIVQEFRNSREKR